MTYTNTNIATIRPDNTFIRPKWGIYRSLLDIGNLRDEAVRFSGFSIQEVAVLETNSNNFEENAITITNPVNETIEFSDSILKNYNEMKLYDISGKILLELNSLTKNIEVSNLKSGMYIIQFNNDAVKSNPIKIIKK
jgi:hypothetical protein